jgi:hypothetical protein
MFAYINHTRACNHLKAGPFVNQQVLNILRLYPQPTVYEIPLHLGLIGRLLPFSANSVYFYQIT